jgi:ribosomal protein S18 acetylase RimI-like enzyme
MVKTVMEFVSEQRKLSGHPAKFSESEAKYGVRTEYLQSKNNVVFLAQGKKTIEGFVRISKIEGSWFINDLWVDKSIRAKGVGTILFNKAIAFLRRKKAAAVYIKALVNNKKALYFYKSLGAKTALDVELELRLDKKKRKKQGKINLGGILFEC